MTRRHDVAVQPLDLTTPPARSIDSVAPRCFFTSVALSVDPLITSSLPRLPTLRLQSIDALRGFVIVLMLIDHVRETFFLHHQVPDPMDVLNTPPDLFFSRLAAHLCAPVFIFLTGLSAWLYGQKAGHTGATSAFLFKRGIFLVVLEMLVINFAWTFQFPPSVVYLQVIWVIGLSMIALSALVWLPRPALIVVGVVLVAGHNLLDSVHFDVGHIMHVPWAILHDRGWIEAFDGLRLRTSYPLLPWIGVIALGYAIGPWFGRDVPAEARQKLMLRWALIALAAFFVLRTLNGYGQSQKWFVGDTLLQTAMSFVNITKYPPSLLFLLLTLGLGLCLLRAFERTPHQSWLRPLCVFGAAPMFFYILHLYVLKALYLAAVSVWGLNQGTVFGVSHMGWIWLITILLAVAMYFPVKAFAALKARRRDVAWLKYL